MQYAFFFHFRHGWNALNGRVTHRSRRTDTNHGAVRFGRSNLTFRSRCARFQSLARIDTLAVDASL